MNVWLIKVGESLPIKDNVRKMRTSFLAEKLLERGHNIVWWTSAFDHFTKTWVFEEDTEIDIKKHFKIKALKGIGYKRNLSLFRYLDHRIIAWKFKRLAQKMPRPDVIVAAMPPHDLAFEAVSFAKRNNIPVLVDIRDQWPDSFIDYLPSSLQKLTRAALFVDFQMVKKTMMLADGLIAVMPEFLEWGLKYAERRKTWRDKVFYLGSKKNTGSRKKSMKTLKWLDALNDKFVVCYIGSFGQHTNPKILLKCAEKLAGTNIFFVLAGGGALFSEIKKSASNISNVILPGWLGQAEILALTKRAQIGVCPATKKTFLFPNKAFTYFSAGLPVISCYDGELKKLIMKHKIGCYYSPNDAVSLLGCIKELHCNKKLYKKMARNSSKLFKELFNADKIYNEYADHVEQVITLKKLPNQDSL